MLLELLNPRGDRRGYPFQLAQGDEDRVEMVMSELGVSAPAGGAWRELRDDVGYGDSIGRSLRSSA